MKASPEARRRDDAGSAIAEFVMVSALVVLLALGVMQLALILHVRNTLIASASEGAHLAALADRSLADGEERAAYLAGGALGEYAITADAQRSTIDGAPAVTVEMTAPVPLVGLWGLGSISVQARAYEEVPRG